MEEPPAVKPFFAGIPCMRSALLTGFSCGALMGLHRIRMGRPSVKAVDAAVLTFVATSGVSWFLCNQKLIAQERALEREMEAQGFKKDPGVFLTTETDAEA
eukprot:TRINITY_DN504_c0_g2_i1.p1 TRINITY_DN504_c0_g2~~TRINITY_DN504_c0_g2_i1.p1  ORF type:complete len:115 (-),score=18.33 TRINITY_DN504_c0_g2_i1:667-969(-)